MKECDWPFHHEPGCGRCEEWEAKYGENLTKYMDEREEIKARQRADRDALRKITERMETA